MGEADVIPGVCSRLLFAPHHLEGEGIATKGSGRGAEESYSFPLSISVFRAGMLATRRGVLAGRDHQVGVCNDGIAPGVPMLPRYRVRRGRAVARPAPARSVGVKKNGS
jgi:hypothetical protein